MHIGLLLPFNECILNKFSSIAVNQHNFFFFSCSCCYYDSDSEIMLKYVKTIINSIESFFVNETS